MKKLFKSILVCAMALSLVACGGSKKDTSNDTNNNDKTDTNVTAPADNENTNPETIQVEKVFHPAISSESGAYATIKISKDIKMDDESAWLGLCPEGKDYITELEADEVDVIWFNYDAREEGDPYVFACDFEGVEDGTYAVVVATSDDENVGYVVIQLSMTKKGDKITFDYTNAKLKERPTK